MSKYIDQLPTLMQAKGYAAVSLDSVYVDSMFAKVSIYFGERYNLDSIRISDEDRKILESLMLPNQKKPLTFYQYESFQQKMIAYLGNKGYPFARVFIDSVEFTRENHVSDHLESEVQ